MLRTAFAAISFLLAALAPAMAQLEPVLHVSFDENFDGVSPKGVVSGTKEERPTLVPGKVGQALKSGPGTGYVQFPTRGIINPVEGTVEMWVCPLDWTFSDREFHVFFDVTQGEGLLCLYKFWELASLLMLGSEKSSGPYDYYGFPAAWEPGEWHHIAGTWSAKGTKEAGVQCFIDGKVWTKFPTPAKLPKRLGAMFRIGDHPWSAAPRKSSSLVDEVRIYDRALSLAHIAAHYRGDYDYCAPLSVKQMRLTHDFEPEKEAVTAYVDVGYTDVADSRLSVRMAIVLKGAALPDNASGGPVAGGKAKQVLPMPTMAPGEYDVVAQLYQDGARFTELRTHLSIPDVKQWQGNTIGLEDRVLPPWTPMRLEGETVRCWGREYVFDGSPLLTQVSSGGQELLTRPLALNATIGGQPVRWKAQVSRGKLSSQSTSVRMGGVLTGTARKTSIRLKVASTVEYDGLHLVELSLPGGEAAVLDRLSLEIPVRRERALYRQRFLYLWDRDRSSGLLPPGEGVVDQDKFTPYYWLADNDRGLFWFCESDEMWPNGQSSGAVQVVRQGDEVVLRLNLLASGQRLPPDWHFTFGLQATPVKPLPKDWRKWRLTPAVKGNLEIIWPVASRSDSLRYHGYPEAMVPDKPFVNRINHLHKRGVKALPYLFLTWFPDNCPEWPFFCKDWGLDGGKREGAYGANIRQISVANKDFQDFVTWKTKEFVEKYGIDGAYHDNTALMPIESIPAGGYVRNGKTYPTYPILSKRRLYRRIYAMYKGLPRETFTIAHTSRSMVIPVLAYEDAILVGEHFRGKVKDNYMDVFSLDTFRAEMMGRQWGVISFFLPEFGGNTGGNEAKEVEPTRGMMALLMIHDVPLWPIWCNAEEVNKALAALDEFGYVNADFIGYFDSMPPAKTDTADVYVSAYKGAGQRALLIAANLSRENRKGLVAIDAARMGVPLKEVLSWPGKEPMEVSEGKVEIEIPKLGYRMLLIGDVGVASIPGGN